MTTNAAILLIEDNEDDVFLMKRAFSSAGITNRLSVAEDGQQAIEYLAGDGVFADRERYPVPAVALLDLKLPIRGGLQVLEWIRSRSDLEGLVVVVLTSSNEPSDLTQAYRLGANSYVVKPPTAAQLLDLANAFKRYWLDFNRFEHLGGRRQGA